MFSISLESVEVKEFSVRAEGFVESLNGLLRDLSSETCESVDAAESVISEVLDACRQELLELYAVKSAGTRVSGRLSCPECQRACRRYRKRGRNFLTLCGEMRVDRWVYVCEAGHWHVPWDIAEGFKDGCTRGVASAMCRLSAQLDYRSAAAELEHQGIKVSHTRLHQKVRKWAAGEKVSDYVDEQNLEAMSRWYVSCDGVQTPSVEGWNEVKMGAVYRTYPQYEGTSAPGARPGSLRYVATREPAADFGQDWYDLATATGIYHNEISLEEEVVVIGDGAAWIWNLADEYFPGAVEILDYMHAKSHLYDIAKHVFGDEDTENVQQWVEDTEPFLYNGDTVEVVARIRALGIGNPDSQDVLEKEVAYFQKHTARMQYKALAEKGYHIGSGIIESACKHVVAERCKQAGMRWTKNGINAILFWRCLLKNGAWDTFWTQLPQAS